MADYPNVGQHEGTDIVPMDNSVIVQRASNGRVRIYDLGQGSQDWFEITVVHLGRTIAERDSIIAHYNAHKDPIVAFDWIYQADNDTYSCYYIGMRPRYVWRSGNTWDITAQIIGTI